MRRTLEDIIPPSRRRAMEQQEQSSEHGTEPKQPHPPRTRRNSYKPALIAGVIIVLAVGALYFLSGASVTIDPMTNTAPLSLSLAAYASTTSPLPFALVTVEKIASQEVAGSGTTNVTQSASGQLTIYNTLSHSQRLVKNTRFASPSNLIFRIHQEVTVPAARGIIPGSITVPVYADAAGSEYNVAPSPFTVPGLVGTTLENKVYAKSTSAMTGGYVGTRATVDPATAAVAQVALQNALLPDLKQSIQKQVPADYLLIPGAATTTFSAAPTEVASTSGKALVREDGVMTAVIFPQAALAKTIESHLMGSYAGQPVRIVDPSAITLTPVGGFPNATTQVFNFSLSGNVTIAWVVNTTQISSAIAGKTRSEANTIMSSFPAVQRAYFNLRPFWVSTFPNDPTKINVTVNAPATAGS
ncbi:MAG: hypothetical protein B7X04_01080 [Parcubacteria group bacterium 21-54-25]|nr:MAG: hypothetical protein B7X04_01080 [Parcubacteria group bacterium 21-54-25]HQU07826.1 hypothetical protein [Candidatus Paceibacterota bacterium]